MRALVVCAAVVVAGRATHATGAWHAVRYLMGTWCDLVVLDPSPNTEAAEAAFQEIARLERVMSNWDPDSEVSVLNAVADRGPHSVSADLASVVHEAKDLCLATNGAFDPSVGAMTHAWGFDTESPAMPARVSAVDAAPHVGCNDVAVQVIPPSITLGRGVRLDLGGIGKGYAVDRALAILRARGIARAKLDFGSSSLGFIGEVEGGWPLVIADPRARENPLASLRVKAGAVSSSSQRERFVEHGGRLYGHIFDPRTGAPVESQLLSVTVIAPTASQADGLSTGLFVLGVEQGRRLVTQLPGVSAIFVEKRRDGVAITTAGHVEQLTRLTR